MQAMLETLFLSPLSIGELEMPFTLLDFFLELILPAVALVLIYRLLLVTLRRMVGISRLAESSRRQVMRWVRRVLRGVLLLLLIGLGSRLLGAKILEYLGIFVRTLNQPILQSSKTSITLLTLFFAIPVFYFASWAGKASRGLLKRSMLSRMGLDEAQQFSVVNLVRYTVMVLVLLVGLSIIGIDLSALTVIFGVLGIGLGFGLQSLVANFFSGLIIIITRPVKEGDRILVNGLEGDIVQIRTVATVINTITNESIIIPNSQLVSESVHNYSFNDATIVVRNDIGVSYASDADRVIELLMEVAYRNPYRLTGKDPFVRFKEFGDSSLNFAVFTWIGSTADKYESHHWTNLEIWRALKRNGVEIPFPQRDVHLRSGWPAPGGGADTEMRKTQRSAASGSGPEAEVGAEPGYDGEGSHG